MIVILYIYPVHTFINLHICCQTILWNLVANGITFPFKNEGQAMDYEGIEKKA